MRLEDYITEAISGKRSHSKQYNSGKEITSKTTLAETLRILDNCGMTRVYKIDSETSVDREFTLDAIRTWNFMYDVVDMPAGLGLTILFIITHRRCYKLYWNARYKNSGPVEGTLREMDKTNGFTSVVSERDEVIDELNTELSTMI
jgi:hypothetical protein